ncbi:hypothetical protein BN85409350 [Alteracholeplasma palmae J233]|uniref:Uncharacterized protein n=1 Tax=Alteracholeplasma palmae (strain ATCC 49389 / J233) TaxID=1318466 RepID=U4KL65_ALTPJ|nr:hypothetical protein [Alteracholeplasma palmae]CCV64512.1 hypothetical protein BN85409350 [Alteracholeplasma palmae J233]
MKWIFRLVYLLVIGFITLIIFDYAAMKKNATYYEENAIPYLKENNMEEYIPHFMTANQVKDYLKKPIYHINYKQQEESLDFSIYHVQSEKSGYLAFFIHNVSMQLESKHIQIELNLKMEGDEKIIQGYYQLDINKLMPLIFLETKKDDLVHFHYENNESEK